MRKATKDEVKGIQLSILNSIDSFCHENGIKYFLMYGSLLGAVRHKGYIPWDDDIDICMLREDYLKFLAIFNASQSQFVVKEQSFDSTFPYYFAKVCDPCTHCYEFIDSQMYDVGINVDLFPLDSLPNDIKKRKEFLMKIKYIRKRMLYNTIDKTIDRVWYKNLVIYLLGIVFNKSVCEYMHEMRKVVEKYEKYPSDDVIEIMTPYGEKAILKKDLFISTTLLPFETMLLLAPREYDAVLSHIYGDYMTPPPMEKQVTHHLYEAFIEK